MNATEVSALPIDQLELLLEDVAELKARAARLDGILSSALHMRFSEGAHAARRAAGKDTGTVRLADGDVVIVADLPKKVEWDQAKLDAAVQVVKGWGENPADYIEVKLSVAERKFEAWPPAIQREFIGARTVSAGKPTYKIVRAAATKAAA
jgi:hypothetical protein